MQPLDELGFPGYYISYNYEIFAEKKPGHFTPVRISHTEAGGPKVNLVDRNGRRTSSTMALIVAKLFVENHNQEVDDAPTHRDGNRANYHPSNLMWRPRWFANEYHRQFNKYSIDDPEDPVYERETGLIFKNIMHACIHYGILYREVLESIESTYPWYNALLFTTYPTKTSWAFYE